jgi:hypothetical protein
MTMTGSFRAKTRVAAIMALLLMTGCDLSQTVSSCQVLGQRPLQSDFGMRVLVDTVVKCPINVEQGGPGTSIQFAVTVTMKDYYLPTIVEGASVFHSHLNRVGNIQSTAYTPWTTLDDDESSSSISRLITVGTGGFPDVPSQLNPAEDQWHLNTPIRNSNVANMTAVVRLTYQRAVNVLIGRDPDVPPGNSIVSLSAAPYATDIAPVKWWWYRDGMYIGEHGPTLSVVTGPPGSSAAYLAVGTDATGRQISGIVIVTPDQPLCGSTPNCNDH